MVTEYYRETETEGERESEREGEGKAEGEVERERDRDRGKSTGVGSSFDGHSVTDNVVTVTELTNSHVQFVMEPQQR